MAHTTVTLSIEESVWLEFKSWCAKHKKVASREVEEYMRLSRR